MKVDYKKIFALYNAGWNNAKIADEMGLTLEEYCNVLTDCLDRIDKQIKRKERAYRRIMGMLTGEK